MGEEKRLTSEDFIIRSYIPRTIFIYQMSLQYEIKNNKRVFHNIRYDYHNKNYYLFTGYRSKGTIILKNINKRLDYRECRIILYLYSLIDKNNKEDIDIISNISENNLNNKTIDDINLSDIPNKSFFDILYTDKTLSELNKDNINNEAKYYLNKIKNVINSLDKNKPIYLSLSGGYDSSLLLYFLNESYGENYKNIIPIYVNCKEYIHNQDEEIKANKNIINIINNNIEMKIIYIDGDIIGNNQFIYIYRLEPLLRNSVFDSYITFGFNKVDKYFMYENIINDYINSTLKLLDKDSVEVILPFRDIPKWVIIYFIFKLNLQDYIFSCECSLLGDQHNTSKHIICEKHKEIFNNIIEMIHNLDRGIDKDIIESLKEYIKNDIKLSALYDRIKNILNI